MLQLLRRLKNYLFSFTYSNSDHIDISNHRTQDQIFGQNLIQKIRAVCPDLPVYFLGSTSLGIPGRGDIDLVATADPNQFEKYKPGLSSILGSPHKTRPDFVEWNTTIDGHEVEVSLMDPQSYDFHRQKFVFDKLSTSSEWKRQYLQLKQSAQGLTTRQYQRLKTRFFDQLMQEDKS